MSYMSL